MCRLFTLFQSPFIQVSPIRRALTCCCLSLWWFEHWKCLGVWSIILSNFDVMIYTLLLQYCGTHENMLFYLVLHSLCHWCLIPFIIWLGMVYFARLLLAPSLIQNFGWDSVFYLFGVLGVAWWEHVICFIYPEFHDIFSLFCQLAPSGLVKIFKAHTYNTREMTIKKIKSILADQKKLDSSCHV